MREHEIEVSSQSDDDSQSVKIETNGLSKTSIHTPVNEKNDNLQTPAIDKKKAVLLLDTKSTKSSQRSHLSSRFSMYNKSMNDFHFDSQPRRSTRLTNGLHQMEDIDEATGSVTILRKKKERNSRMSVFSKGTSTTNKSAVTTMTKLKRKRGTVVNITDQEKEREEKRKLKDILKQKLRDRIDVWSWVHA